MRRPDYDFVRKALRSLDRPEGKYRDPLVKKMILESLHAPVISFWGEPFPKTRPGLFKERHGDPTPQDWYESKTSWLYDDFVFLVEDFWKENDNTRGGPANVWTYFVKNCFDEDHPLCAALEEDAASSSFFVEELSVNSGDIPEEFRYDLNTKDLYFALTAMSFFENGQWDDPVIVGIYCFWIPELDDAIYLPSDSDPDPYSHLKWAYFPTKSSEDFDTRRSIPQSSRDEVRNSVAKQLVLVADMHRYLKYGDRHAVEVLPNPEKLAKSKRNPANRTRPWNTASGPHVLLLDRMPTTQKPKTGTHASPKPHHRRGHWKTLSHPRYRHHPQYQKKIYVKPSFVGPRQTKYEGNIYRLVQPLEERLS